MRLELPQDAIVFLERVLPNIFEGSTLYLQGDISVLDADMQKDWQAQLHGEAKTDASLVLQRLTTLSTNPELTEAEAESFLRSLTGVRLYLANTTLADSNIEDLNQVLIDAITQNDLKIIHTIQLYLMLQHIESAILQALFGTE